MTAKTTNAHRTILRKGTAPRTAPTTTTGNRKPPGKQPIIPR